MPGLATLIVAVGVVFGLFTIGQAVTGQGRDEIAVHHQIDGRQVKELPEHVIRPHSVEVTSKLSDASRGDKWLAAGRDLGPIVLIVALAFIARSILRSVRDGDPFTDKNVGRLRAVGFLFLVGLPVVTVFSSMLNSELARSLDHKLTTGTDFSFTGPMISLGVFALAELFSQGVRLRQDVEGTV